MCYQAFLRGPSNGAHLYLFHTHARTHAHTHARTHAHTHTHTHTHLEYGKAIVDKPWIVKYLGVGDRESCNEPSHGKDDKVPVVRGLEELSVLAVVQVEDQQPRYFQQEEDANCKLQAYIYK